MSDVYQIRITLKKTKPPIWRKVAVASDITLGRLHEVIQIVMGWTNSHLHQFVLRDSSVLPTAEEVARRFLQDAWDEDFLARMRGERVFVPKKTFLGDDTELDGEDEDAVTLAEVCPGLKTKLTYEYDFGDGWEHTIEVQKITQPEEGKQYPLCLNGKRACPPEDCGGVSGYYRMLEALEDPKHEGHALYRERFGGRGFDPEAFDLEAVNAKLGAWARVEGLDTPQ